MGNAGRIVCVTLPLVLSLACAVCLTLVLLGNQNKSSSLETKFYFLRADTTNFSYANVATSAAKLAGVKHMADWYTIGLWNYCLGSNSNMNVPEWCSKPQWAFYFDPVAVWGLKNTPLMPLLPVDFHNAINAYAQASKFMFIGYIVAVVAAGVTPVLAIFAYCSRIGSLFTTLSSSVAALFTVGSSAAAIAIFGIVKGELDTKLGQYGLKTNIGRSMFILTWAGAAFACFAVFFWLFSICCCGADHSRKQRAKKTPTWRDQQTYERVPSPYVGGYPTPAPQQDRWYASPNPNAGYEPYKSSHYP